ncbi:MAG: sulfotransferase family protein [Rhodanobacteraceae bacterium]
MDQGTLKPVAATRGGRIGPVIDRPIFIVGAGRSGSTVFHRIFCEHPGVAWQSPLCDLFPARPSLNRMLLGSAGWPLLGIFLERYLRPGERYRFWEHYCRGFAQPCRDLVGADVTPVHRRTIPPALARLATSRRRRVLIKVTGWPRVGFLRELFPDAKFIHVYRDGRAVASSLLAVHFWRGWRGPPQWGFGALDPAQQAEWEYHGRSFVALAGIQWKLLMAAMDAAVQDLAPRDLLQVRYEDFIADPAASFKAVASFCELDWSAPFERLIGRHRLATANDKWRENLTAAQQAILEQVLADSLRRYGYPVRAYAADDACPSRRP